MVGSRDVLIIAPLAALLGVVAGTILGLIMGFYRGVVDDVLSRLVEAFLALPVILVALLDPRRPGHVADRGHPRGRYPVHADRRSHRAVGCPVGAAAGLRHGCQVSAARSGPFILSREIFPNVLGPTVVEMTVRFGYAIFTVATLSFLGVGLQPPSPDWGLSVSQEYNNMISGSGGRRSSRPSPSPARSSRST